MPSTPSILSDPSTTFAGYPELAAKVDESPVADADLDEYAGAAYPNFVDTCLKDVNKAARGEAAFTEPGVSAAFAGAVDDGNWQPNAKDIIIGDGVLSRGISLRIPATGAGSFIVRTPTQSVGGGLAYDPTNTRTFMYVDGSAELVVEKSVTRPGAPKGNQLGSSLYPYKRLELQGNAVINSDPSATAGVLFRDGGTPVYSFVKLHSGEMRLVNVGASNEISMELPAAGGIILGDSGGDVGFYGTSPQPKPTVTGSRGGNAALTSLLSALHDLGLITNSTTA